MLNEIKSLKLENQQMRNIMVKLANNSDRNNELTDESLATLQSIEEASYWHNHKLFIV